MLISVLKSSGALLAAGGAPYYGQSRPADSVPVRSSTRVQVCFYDDNGNPTLLDAAVGTLTFTAQPAAGDLFTVGTTTYKAVATLTGAANEVFLGANLTGFIANLIGAVNASTTTPETPGTTYGVGTVQNTLAGATAGPGSTVLFTAWQADASGNTVATTTTSAHASFGGPTLGGADILNLDLKPTGEYDANFTFVTPTFTAPANPANGYYTGTLTTSSTAGNTLLDPNNPGGGTSAAIEPDAVTLMAQLRWGPASATLPARSNKWSVSLTNSVGNGAEGVTLDPPSVTLAAVQTAIAQAKASAAQVPYAYANYAAMAAGAVDSAILGETATFTPLAGVGTQNFFSTYNPSTHTYARNPACVFSWPSWASVGNSANVDGTGGNRGCVVMISATEGITAHHYEEIYAAGVTHDFLGGDGATYTLDIATSVQIGTTDVQLVTFTTLAPAAVGIAPVLAPGVMAQIFGVGTPLVATNQQKQAVVVEIAAATPTNPGNEIYFRAATASNRTAWTVTPPAIPGDSSSPIWAYLDGTAFIVSDWHVGNVNPSSGPSIAECAPLINAAMVAGSSLNVLPTNTLGLGTAAYAALGTTAGQVPVLNENNQIDPGLLPPGSADGSFAEAITAPGVTTPNVPGTGSLLVLNDGVTTQGQTVIDGNYGVELTYGGNPVLNVGFQYVAVAGALAPQGTWALGASFAPWAELYIASTITPTGTTGAQVINKARGTVRFAAGASTLTVTNSLVASTSKLIAHGVGAFDATATRFQVTAASGSFTINANAAATAPVEVYFDLVIP